MSVYRNDKPEFVHRAIESISSLQMRMPDEILIIIDGPVPAPVNNVINNFRQSAPSVFRVIQLPENRGLGEALRIGVEAAIHPIIARMDSDDVALSDRFEKQIAYLENNPLCDIVGGQITEFIDDENNIIGRREVPCSHSNIISYIKSRCPFNHMAVTFRKSAVIKAGNYRTWHYNEDYYLWIRMAEAGCIFANLPDTLVNVRVGKEMYARRGGWKYFQSEKDLQRYMHQAGILSYPRYLYNIIGRFAVQVVLPNRIRGWLFRELFRKKHKLLLI